ncbi:putative phosphopantothenoylcysteine decarboxylase protein [Eutypa lata UCREL1]|uniref:Putative phosphopantothenoylcysteine decarboxylase protein n=1 Tax=Eutypa lata (strain UCR-EL1) TaxID=1287681 RepID=M7TVU5_EUTLA|nr:putative phosphopantothenoylcysteine decarboxylase protein [Eutypa lata UCREL1]
MPRTRKLRLLVAANGPRDVAYAQAIAVRLLKDAQIETRALVDEVPLRLTHDIIVMENRSLATLTIDADQRTREAIDSARQTAFELVDWADLLVLAPIDADHLAKMMCGVADTTLLEILRAWDVSKKILLVPGMSVQMWENPTTKKQLSKIKRKWSWVKVMAPVLWHYEGAATHKRVVSWEGFNDLVGIIKNQAELMSLGHDVEVAAQQAMHPTGSSRINTVLPPEIWSLIFEHVGDWEVAKALDVYTNLKTPPEWRTTRVYGRTDILDWWNISPSFLKKEYDAEALDNASRMGYVHVLDWWLRSGLTLKYTEAALEQASAKGHLLVLEWWRDAALKDSNIMLKPGRSLLSAAQQGQTAVLRWWENSGIPIAHSEGSHRRSKATSRYSNGGSNMPGEANKEMPDNIVSSTRPVI